jgi:hypothetical protein
MSAEFVPERIVSGGQTGVDRAALDVALALGLPCGGFCPRGRRAEDGRIPDRYPLQETPGWAYSERTLRNVRESDATLVLHRGALRGGSALTVRLARRLRRPCLAVDLASDPDPAEAIRLWLASQAPRVLNIAGPRESQAPGIAAQAGVLLHQVLDLTVR